jgi:hypothetical protein
MPLQKILFKPGINKENTRYTTEGGYYDADKIRFRQGNPEKIGGWTRFSPNTFLGICRSLWNWTTLGNLSLIGLGTNLKFYIESGGNYYDVTPLRDPHPVVLTDPFTATSTSAVITVTAASHGCLTGDFVTYSGATGLGGNITAAVLNKEYQITVINSNVYTITASVAANASDTGHGGTVNADYQINTGPAIQTPLNGWGAGAWGYGTWGVGEPSTTSLQLWNQYNFGQNLVYGPRGGGLYYWDAALGVTTRGVDLTTLGDGDTPVFQNVIIVSDASRFVIVMGTNDYGTSVLDPMLIRWSDQEDPLVWTPAITNQAGSVRLSHGSQIITCIQTRQEIVIITDQAVYSLQYLGPPFVWGSQLLGDNISIISPNATSLASGVVYWMGVDKFYKYDGRVQTLNCDLRRYIFNDINIAQTKQIFSSTNEGFNEVWWFYCSANSDTIDKYAIYNYLENIWYYGTMARTAWLDSGLLAYPIAATYLNNLVNHEDGVDDSSTGTPVAIEAYVASSEFDIGDGHNFGYIWRVLPDLTFDGSTPNTSAQVTMSLYPMQNSGSGVGTPGVDYVNKISSYNITEEFTGIVYTRVRGRQLIFKMESNQLGTTWQLGAPRIDIRPDGRR